MWHLINRPRNLSGIETDEFTADARDSFDELLESFLANDVIIYDRTLSDAGTPARVVIQNKTTDIFRNAMMRQVLARIGTLESGRYVKYRDNYILISTLPDNNDFYEKAMGWICRHSVSFVSPVTGNVVTYPVYNENATQYGTGETERASNLVNILDASHVIYIPYNDETVLIQNGYRFVIDRNTVSPKSYRVTQADTESYAVGKAGYGIIRWSVLQDQARAADGLVADNTTAAADKLGW